MKYCFSKRKWFGGSNNEKEHFAPIVDAYGVYLNKNLYFLVFACPPNLSTALGCEKTILGAFAPNSNQSYGYAPLLNTDETTNMNNWTSMRRLAARKNR